mmetsp:Transcript_44769/g.127846  ORF Transcript_44769/g.127846 Transcript_44769/m.127846 type:complete len:259 (-) Transcript_44769:56-832(-)
MAALEDGRGVPVEQMLEFLVQVVLLGPEDVAGLLQRLLARLLLIVEPLDVGQELVEGLVGEAAARLAEELLAVDRGRLLRPWRGRPLGGRLLRRWGHGPRVVPGLALQCGHGQRRVVPQKVVPPVELVVVLLDLGQLVVRYGVQDVFPQALKPPQLTSELRHRLEELFVLVRELRCSLVALHQLHLQQRVLPLQAGALALLLLAGEAQAPGLLLHRLHPAVEGILDHAEAQLQLVFMVFGQMAARRDLRYVHLGPAGT